MGETDTAQETEFFGDSDFEAEESNYFEDLDTLVATSNVIVESEVVGDPEVFSVGGEEGRTRNLPYPG